MTDIVIYKPATLLCDSPHPTDISYAGRERVHRVEFINWKAYTICNVEMDGTWHTCQFPASTTAGEFLWAGGLSNVQQWRKGRIYKDEE